MMIPKTISFDEKSDLMVKELMIKTQDYKDYSHVVRCAIILMYREKIGGFDKNE